VIPIGDPVGGFGFLLFLLIAWWLLLGDE